jgi:hypothetical protein
MKQKDKIHVMKREQKSDHKIIILGYSHALGLAGRLKDTLYDNFEIIGYTKPNCKVKSLIDSIQDDITNLSSNNVLMCGSNDLGQNNIYMSLRHISEFVKTNSHTNVIIATAPHHYDSVASSMANEEVLKFNRQLKKYVKKNTHAPILEIEQDRKYFTNHGLDLNNMGKEIICKQIKEIVEKTFIVICHLFLWSG